MVARCTVTRVFKAMGLRGAVCGQRVTTTVPEPLAQRPQDLAHRNVTATRPNQLWVSDLTYVPTWRGVVCVAFETDAYARRIVGGRATTTLRTDLALDALEQALYDRALEDPLVQRSDRGSKYLAIRGQSDFRKLASRCFELRISARARSRATPARRYAISSRLSSMSCRRSQPEYSESFS